MFDKKGNCTAPPSGGIYLPNFGKRKMRWILLILNFVNLRCITLIQPVSSLCRESQVSCHFFLVYPIFEQSTPFLTQVVFFDFFLCFFFLNFNNIYQIMKSPLKNIFFIHFSFYVLIFISYRSRLTIKNYWSLTLIYAGAIHHNMWTLYELHV